MVNYQDDSSDRMAQIVSNLNWYYSSNPNAAYFKDWNSFANQFSYNDRSQAQQQVLRSWFEDKFKWSGTSTNLTNSTSTTTQKVNYNWNSLTQYLSTAWWTDTSLKARKPLADQLWIKNYSWKAWENDAILKALRNWTISLNWDWTHNYWPSPTAWAWKWVNDWTNINEPVSDSWRWDYTTNDPDRLQEVRNNIEKWYVHTRPDLFVDRWTYNQFFHYNERWPEQKAILDELFEKYNRSDAATVETQILEQEKKFEQDKRDDKLATLQDIIDQLNDRRDDIEWKMNDRLRDARANLDDIANNYMAKIAQIQQLYDDYYPKAQQAMQEKMAWEMAWLTSEMSAKKMSWLLRNSLYWIEQNYRKMFNTLLADQANLANELNKNYWTFMLQLQQERDNLDQNEYDMLVTWYDNFKATLDALSQAQQTSIDEINRAWENWYRSRTDAVTDEAWTNAKKETKNSAYKAMDFYSRAQYLTDNLVKIIWDWETLDNYNYNVIKYAAENFNDLTEALNYIAQNWRYQKKTTSSSTKASTTSWVDSTIASIWNSLEKEDSDINSKIKSTRDALG